MASRLLESLSLVITRVLELARHDAELAGQLRTCAQSVIAELESAAGDEAKASSGAQPIDRDGRDRAPTAPHFELVTAALETAIPTAKLPELTLGRPTAPPLPAKSASYTVVRDTSSILALIEQRCRLKAEACRWAAKRRRLIAEGASFQTEIDPIHHDIIARARELPDCFLWMCHNSGPSPADLTLYGQAAGCFDALADAVALVRQLQENTESTQAEFDGAIDLAAEAQSALRVAIVQIDGRPDSDQNEVFHLLRNLATERQTLIYRFMRLDDPADPSRWADLLSRIEAADTRLHEVRRRAKLSKKLLGKVRHKASLIADGEGNADGHWRIIGATVAELLQGGMPPSNRELRELLVPVIEQLPDGHEMSPEFSSVLRELDRFMATCAPQDRPPPPPNQDVLNLYKRLHGRSIVLIGGDRRPGPQKALKDAFGLADLHWLETPEHTSIDRFHPYVARPEVAVVLLAIRWSSHSYGEVRDFCDRYGKPLVRLPGGYNQNQVAAQIMAQCSDRLD